MEPGFTRGKQMSESSKILWSKGAEVCLQGWSQMPPRTMVLFSLQKVETTEQWWYSQKILCLPAITWALCACQSTRGRASCAKQGKGRYFVCWKHNNIYRAELYLTGSNQFPLLTDTAIFSCRKARKEKSPQTFYCLRSLCLPRLLCCILLTHFPKSNKGFFCIKLLICRVLPAFSRK